MNSSISVKHSFLTFDYFIQDMSFLFSGVYLNLLLRHNFFLFEVSKDKKMTSPLDHCYAGVDITPTSTSLSSMKRVLPQGWTHEDRAPSPVPNKERTDTTL